jgi:hypothetical protein
VPVGIAVRLATAAAAAEVKILDPPPVMLRVTEPPVPALKYCTIMSRIFPDGAGIETVMTPVLPAVPVMRNILVAAVIDAVAVVTFDTVRSPVGARPKTEFSGSLRTLEEPEAVRS